MMREGIDKGMDKWLKADIKDRKQEITNNTQLIQSQNTEIKTLQSEAKMLSSNLVKMQDDVMKMQGTLTDLKLKGEPKGNEFPINKIVVAQCVWYDENEHLRKVAETIIHKGLNLPEINIVRVLWKSGSDSCSGLSKIEVSSPDEVKQILKEKKLLKDALVKELRKVFLRNSKREEVLIMECNVDLLLSEIGMRDDYV